MKKILILGIAALSAISGYSQANNSNFDMYSRTIDLNVKSQSFGLTEAAFNAIKDEAYVNPEFVSGKIYSIDQLLQDNVQMRYNAYADEFEIRKNNFDESYSALIKDPEIMVEMGGDVYVLVPLNGNNEKGGYFNVLNDGKTYDLYKKTTATFREPRTARTNYERDTPPSFSKTTTYYLVENGTFLEMPSKKSKILKMMDKKKNEIKDYIKENNLDIEKEADMIKVVSYFDSIL